MIDIELPKWGMTMQDGTLVEWLVESGSSVTEGQVIATVETEKVMAELESPASGVISEILVSEGQTAAVGAVLARIQTSND